MSTEPSTAVSEPIEATQPTAAKSTLNEPTPSFIKLAMRNMVKKGGKSLYHFFLSFVGLLGLFIGLAYLTR
ncbi:MAG: DUF3285 domain-containing protein [Cyanobacteria bacterium P01_D01_bin.36]